MQQWTVHLHPDADAELRALPLDVQARLLRVADLLKTFGPQRVGMPHVRPLDGKLWEMRAQGRDGIARAIYIAMRGRTLTVLHVFVKKTQTTPRAALETARRRLEAMQ